MILNIEKYKKDIGQLIRTGESLLKILNGDNENLLQFREKYEIWYSEAYYLVKSVLPDRLKDFELYYENKKGDSLRRALTYTPPRSEGVKLDFEYIPAEQIDYARSLFINQLAIIKSIKTRFESSLFDIKQVVQADLFDSELDAAKELNKKGFSRGAGAIAGVVLEGHLSQVCVNYKITVKKKNPVINDFGQLLKDNDVIETPTWRKIQYLADLRNLCDHKKKTDPNKDDINDLINGVSKIIKTLF
jgi:hypothetical protein